PWPRHDQLDGPQRGRGPFHGRRLDDVYRREKLVREVLEAPLTRRRVSSRAHLPQSNCPTAVTPGSRAISLRFLAEPGDVNFGGKVHGGAVMKWIDQAGYTCAVGWSGHYCVTAYVGGIRFVRPILIGHLVEVAARVIYTGRTSMHIEVEVKAGDPREGVMSDTTHCTMVFV